MNKKPTKNDKATKTLLQRLDDAVSEYARATSNLTTGAAPKRQSPATQVQVKNARLAALAIVYYSTQRQLEDAGPSATIAPASDTTAY